MSTPITKTVSVKISINGIEADKLDKLNKWLLTPARVKAYGVSTSTVRGKIVSYYVKALPERLASDLRLKTNPLCISIIQ